MSGLLIAGKLVLVPSVNIISPHEQPWCFLTIPKDGCPRTNRPHQYILHKTIADDPEQLIPGAGADDARLTAEFWQKSDGSDQPKRYSGAHLVTGSDGTVACLADLALVEAYHATVSNLYSVGHETRELAGGGFHLAAGVATIETCLEGTRSLGIQWQCPKPELYNGHPLQRMLNGGIDCVGIFGHRDNTEARGRWDPGDWLFRQLMTRGVEAFDFAAGEDRDTWGMRQAELNARGGYGLVEDGIPGPKTTAALRSDGFTDGIWALGRAA